MGENPTGVSRPLRFPGDHDSLSLEGAEAFMARNSRFMRTAGRSPESCLVARCLADRRGGACPGSSHSRSRCRPPGLRCFASSSRTAFFLSSDMVHPSGLLKLDEKRHALTDAAP